MASNRGHNPEFRYISGNSGILSEQPFVGIFRNFGAKVLASRTFGADLRTYLR